MAKHLFLMPQRRQSLSLPKRAAKNILLVDDNDRVLSLLDTVLTQAGYDVFACTSGHAALQRFQANRVVDLLLTDYEMPGMSGLLLASTLRCLAPNLPVLILSGASHKALEQVWEEGWDFLPKPTNTPLLLQTVAKLCTKPPAAPSKRSKPSRPPFVA